MKNTITVAVAGNPNSGKSTLINAIAGTRLHVGNWPGVTVEKKEATLEYKGTTIRLIDLPGTYSLSPYTIEENVARDFLVRDRPDVILDVVDATNLERNLYLTLQLLELEIPTVVSLNIFDEAANKGYTFDTAAMSEELGAKIVPTVAVKKTGLDELMEAVVAASKDKAPLKRVQYGHDIDSAVSEIKSILSARYGDDTAKYPQQWLALKFLENDSRVLGELPPRIVNNGVMSNESVGKLKKNYGEDMESLMAEARYGKASQISAVALTKSAKPTADLTDKIDRIVLNKYLGIPIFLAAMWLLFKLTFDLSGPFVDWIDGATGDIFTPWTEQILGAINAPDWVISLATKGVLSGMGFVLVFVPVIFAMMFFITLLEMSGYMARAAFIMDRVMSSVGLHGKSFIPMLLGFGCNVPGIYATRTLENEKDRILTSLLIPFTSCGARLPVYVLFAAAFFPESSGTVVWSLYIMGIVLALLVGIVLRRTMFKGESPMFIMELPPYRMPSLSNLALHTWEKGKHFLIKAGTWILAVSIFVWFLLNLPWGVEDKKDSYLGVAGQVVAPVLQPLGFGNWQAGSALITGIIAKEIVVGTMGEIYAHPEPAAEAAADGDKPAAEAAPVPEQAVAPAADQTPDAAPEAAPAAEQAQVAEAKPEGEAKPADEAKSADAAKPGEEAAAPAEEDKGPLGFGDGMAQLGSGFVDASKAAGLNFIASFGLYTPEEEPEEEDTGVRAAVSNSFTPLSAYSFMVFVLLYMPCVVTAIAYKQEFGTWKWFWVSAGISFGLAWGVSLVIYQGGRLLGLGV